MQERKAVTRTLSVRYRMAAKKTKGVILDEFIHVTGYHRAYARAVLRRCVSGSPPSPSRSFRLGRKPTYDHWVQKALKELWGILDFICGKRLAAALPEVLPILEKHHEIHLEESIRKKLLAMSPATMDRLLSPERKRLALKGRSGTKPGTLLKHQIPIRTFSDWNEKRPGFLEFDLVGHDGGDARGDFAQTLDGTDVCTGWTETSAVKNKAQVWVFEAFQGIQTRLPFPLLGMDSDNGSEFINNQMLRYCQSHRITFTRARSYRKNDNCFVEQKNYSVVRKAVGYWRYETEGEVSLLNELYRFLRLYSNFFLPVMKLVEKTRVGSKVKKRYDDPKTPYRRVLESPDVANKCKHALKALYATLNPAELKREITRRQTLLFKRAQQNGKRLLPEEKIGGMGKRRPIRIRSNEVSEAQRYSRSFQKFFARKLSEKRTQGSKKEKPFEKISL